MGGVVIKNAELPVCCAECFAFDTTCNLLPKLGETTNIWKERDTDCPLCSNDKEPGNATLEGNKNVNYICGKCSSCGIYTPYAEYCMRCGSKLV